MITGRFRIESDAAGRSSDVLAAGSHINRSIRIGQ